MTLRIQPSRYRRTIAGELAHALLDALDPSRPDGCESEITRDAVRVSLLLDRHWAPRDGEGMPFEHRIGGLATLFVASARPWKHRLRPTFVRLRMQDNWQPEDLARSIFEAMEDVRQSEGLAALREQVFDEMQAREIVDALPERLDGHTTRFEEMTAEDCAFWLEWLRALPMQTFAYKAPLPWRPGTITRRVATDED